LDFTCRRLLGVEARRVELIARSTEGLFALPFNKDQKRMSACFTTPQFLLERLRLWHAK
jgi:hypothetical protein